MSTIVQQIVRRDIPATIIYESRQVIAFLDHDPISPGHCLICPVEPICNFPDLPWAVLMEIQQAAAALYRRLEQKYAPQGISFIQNNGDCNELDHYHLHIFPRFAGDGFAWSEGGPGLQTPDQLAAQADGLYLSQKDLVSEDE